MQQSSDRHFFRIASRTAALTRLSDIRNRFGDRVADIVRSCSDSVVNIAAGEEKDDWEARKKRYIKHLNTVDQETWLSVSFRQNSQCSVDTSRFAKA
jgi:hypothetical protein